MEKEIQYNEKMTHNLMTATLVMGCWVGFTFGILVTLAVLDIIGFNVYITK